MGLPGQAVEKLVVDLEVLRQGEQRGWVVGDVVQVLHEEDLPQVAQQVVDELRVARAAFGQALHEQQGGRRVAFDDDVDDLEEQLGGDHAEHVEHLARADRGRAKVGRQLLERADGVAKAALGVACDLEHGGLVDLDVLAGRDLVEHEGDVVHPRPAKVEALAAREDGRRDLVDLGRGEHEDDVGGRLLEGLQEGVEGLLGEHVGLVDDVDLVAAPDRRIADLVAQLADVVDAAVGGGVHLDHVERRRGGDGAAAFAHCRTA